MRSSKEQSLRATNSICWPLHKKKNHYRTKNAARRKKVKFQTILNPIQSNANIKFTPPEKEGNKPIIIKRRGSSNKQDRQKEGRKKKKNQYVPDERKTKKWRRGADSDRLHRRPEPPRSRRTALDHDPPFCRAQEPVPDHSSDWSSPIQ